MNGWEIGVLYVHLGAAVLFVGGSFFFWLVLEPVTYTLNRDESERTALVAKVARRFGQFTHPLLVILVASGIYNATWYLPSPSALTTTAAGELLLAKGLTVVVLIVLIYLHGAYYGPKIVRLARERRYDDLRALRRRSRAVSMINLALMLAVLLLAVLLQSYP
ncbi:conserved hypothetical protein, membrane [mine drainage metagenome]|uniref:Copper resistance protein D domain-containing protein n=1 Tax=mine drainage metagenome TaxID=410659 RepID=T0ZMU6_9ZZZZ